MKTSRKPWSTKLRPDMQHSFVEDPRGRGKMLLPTPLLLAAEIQKIPAGYLITMPELRNRLAQRYDADLCCALMCGIFYNIIAGTAEEQITAQLTPIAPYWRVILDKGLLSEKTPCGSATQAARLIEEGHLLTEIKGKRCVVQHEQRLHP